MRIALFSDIHANLPALEAVLADIDARGPEAVYCLGDLVGYAPWPNEVARLIRDRHIPTIAGNYDFGVGRNSDDCGCAYKTEEDRARGDESIAYTNSIVEDDVRAYLSGLPRHFRIELGQANAPFTLLLVHGSPRKMNEYLFEDRPDASFLRMMETAGADVMCFGHTHKPFHKCLRCELNGAERFRHVINIGSVGKPKDGDPRACYVMLNFPADPDPRKPDSLQIEFIRVEYDVEKAADAVEQSPLPDAFAAMLRDAK